MTAPDWIGLDDIPSIADERWADRNGQPDTTALDSWTPINLAELPEQSPVQPTLGQVGIVYPGKRHVFSGPQESAKTLIAYGIALRVTATSAPVVLIDFEMGRWDARNRLRELGASTDDLARIHYLEPAEPATLTAIGRLLALQPQLVIVDAAAGAYDIQGLDDNKRSDVEKFTRIYVRAFWLADIATIVLDHVVKNTEGRGNYAIGSERKVGGTDVHLGFETITPIKRGSSGLYKIVTHKDRMGFLKRGKLADVELASDTDTHAITWTLKHATETDPAEPFRPTHLMEAVSRYLSAQNEPRSYNEICTHVKGKAEYVRTAIDCLASENYAAVEHGPRGAKLVTHTTSYIESHDLVPPRPDLVPDEVNSNPSTSSPPTGGRDGVDRPGNRSPRPQTPNDDIPF